MTHYETLGVPRDATSAQIKRAFRKAAMRAHPDREGGSAERMAAVNAAYEQLGDEGRRKVYDETGADAPLNQDTTAAEMTVMQALQSVIDGPALDIVRAARDQLQRSLSVANAQIRACDDAIRKAKALRPKVKGPVARNLVHRILDTRVEQASQQLAAGQKALETIVEAMSVLDAYSMVAEGTEAARGMTFITGAEFQRYVGSSPKSSGPFQATRPEDGL